MHHPAWKFSDIQHSPNIASINASSSHWQINDIIVAAASHNDGRKLSQKPKKNNSKGSANYTNCSALCTSEKHDLVEASCKNTKHQTSTTTKQKLKRSKQPTALRWSEHQIAKSEAQRKTWSGSPLDEARTNSCPLPLLNHNSQLCRYIVHGNVSFLAYKTFVVLSAAPMQFGLD